MDAYRFSPCLVALVAFVSACSSSVENGGSLTSGSGASGGGGGDGGAGQGGAVMSSASTGAGGQGGSAGAGQGGSAGAGQGGSAGAGQGGSAGAGQGGSAGAGQGGSAGAGQGGGAGAGGAPCSPQEEACNGVDDDCDGVIDDNPADSGQPCMTGQPGVCAGGQSQCDGGALVCMPLAAPGAEACNAVDDDCDGSIDEEFPDMGVPCSTGQPGICEVGDTQCSGGSVVCVALAMPQAEACNGVDDDCDGVIDNGDPEAGAPCSTGNPGVCDAGTTVCSAGALTCQQTKAPSPEKCNALDDDCDGQVDEGQPGACQPCGPPGPPGTCPAYSICVNGVVMCGPQPPQGPQCPPPPPPCGGIP